MTGSGLGPPPAAGLGPTGLGPADDERREQRAALARLALVVGVAIVASLLAGVVKTVIVVLALILMIMLHELGHLLTAKWGHMKVTEYFLGFGPRLWSIRRGETEYGIKALWVGGYVKIPGMTNLERVDPADEPRTYRQQPFWRRLSDAVAGSTVHFLLALGLFWMVIVFVGYPNFGRIQVAGLLQLESGQVPARMAGFQVGDEIVAVDSNRIDADHGPADYIQGHPGQTVTFLIRRHGRLVTLTDVPLDLSKVAFQGVPVANTPTGFVGINLGPVAERANPAVAVGRAGREVASFSVLTV